MLAQPYQSYIAALSDEAVRQLKANGKFNKSAVQKAGPVQVAASGSYAHTQANAKVRPDESAKFINGEIAKSTFSTVKRVHKALKKKGLVELAPALAVPPVAVAAAAVMPRRSVVTGLLAGAAVLSVVAVPTAAEAGDKAYWSKVKKQLKPFLKAYEANIAKALTA